MQAHHFPSTWDSADIYRNVNGSCVDYSGFLTLLLRHASNVRGRPVGHHTPTIVPILKPVLASIVPVWCEIIVFTSKSREGRVCRGVGKMKMTIFFSLNDHFGRLETDSSDHIPVQTCLSLPSFSSLQQVIRGRNLIRLLRCLKFVKGQELRLFQEAATGSDTDVNK